jgi:hypothetical protein
MIDVADDPKKRQYDRMLTAIILMPVRQVRMSIYHLAQQSGQLEELAKERLRQHAKNDGTLLRYQLVKFGVCPCECHTSQRVHASHPCCVQARSTNGSSQVNANTRK